MLSLVLCYWCHSLSDVYNMCVAFKPQIYFSKDYDNVLTYPENFNISAMFVY